MFNDILIIYSSFERFITRLEIKKHIKTLWHVYADHILTSKFYKRNPIHFNLNIANHAIIGFALNENLHQAGGGKT